MICQKMKRLANKHKVSIAKEQPKNQYNCVMERKTNKNIFMLDLFASIKHC